MQLVKQSPLQKAKNFACSTFDRSTAFIAFVLTLLMVTITPSYANTGLPELTIDVAGLMKAFGVIIAAIATIGMGVLTVTLMAKAFKYIRTAL